MSNQETTETQQADNRPIRTTLVDDANVACSYANFCRVTGTPEEIAMDFGLQLAYGVSETPVEVNQRIVMNFFSAKRLLATLQAAIAQHEQNFGTVELDIAQRATVRPKHESSSGEQLNEVTA